MLGISDLKTGRNIIFNDEPYIIVWNQFSKTGRQGGVMKTKMKNLISGSVVEKTFQGSDKVDAAEITYQKAQFLYANGDDFEFMDNESFEQMAFTREQLGDAAHFLTDGVDCDVQYFNGSPINVQLPAKMTFTITETEPGVKGNTAGSVTKNAVIETGYELKVPPFLNQGEKIIINTLNGEYVERAK